ncbi:Staygreen protein [Sesbania bispinosa]|nr:Staygreen protein [Sesbania bispinosa]
MGTLTTAFLPSKLKPSLSGQQVSLFPHIRRLRNKNQAIVPVARLFGPASLKLRKLKGWDNRLQRDEVVAPWRKIKGKMSLHVHCHISGGIEGFHSRGWNLFNNYPELQEALVGFTFTRIAQNSQGRMLGSTEDACASSKGSHYEKDHREAIVPPPTSKESMPHAMPTKL